MRAVGSLFSTSMSWSQQQKRRIAESATPIVRGFSPRAAMSLWYALIMRALISAGTAAGSSQSAKRRTHQAYEVAPRSVQPRPRR